MLAGEGFTVSDGARGTIVNPALPRAIKPVPLVTAAAQARRRRTASACRRSRCCSRWACRRSMRFRASSGRRSRRRVARQLDVEQLAHPHDVMGYEPLRHAIASYLRIARDIACRADQVLITAGFSGRARADRADLAQAG